MAYYPVAYSSPVELSPLFLSIGVVFGMFYYLSSRDREHIFRMILLMISGFIISIGLQASVYRYPIFKFFTYLQAQITALMVSFLIGFFGVIFFFKAIYFVLSRGGSSLLKGLSSGLSSALKFSKGIIAGEKKIIKEEKKEESELKREIYDVSVIDKDLKMIVQDLEKEEKISIEKVSKAFLGVLRNMEKELSGIIPILEQFYQVWNRKLARVFGRRVVRKQIVDLWKRYVNTVKEIFIRCLDHMREGAKLIFKGEEISKKLTQTIDKVFGDLDKRLKDFERYASDIESLIEKEKNNWERLRKYLESLVDSLASSLSRLESGRFSAQVNMFKLKADMQIEHAMEELERIRIDKKLISDSKARVEDIRRNISIEERFVKKLEEISKKIESRFEKEVKSRIKNISHTSSLSQCVREFLAAKNDFIKIVKEELEFMRKEFNSETSEILRNLQDLKRIYEDEDKYFVDLDIFKEHEEVIDRTLAYILNELDKISESMESYLAESRVGPEKELEELKKVVNEGKELISVMKNEVGEFMKSMKLSDKERAMIENLDKVLKQREAYINKIDKYVKQVDRYVNGFIRSIERDLDNFNKAVNGIIYKVFSEIKKYNIASNYFVAGMNRIGKALGRGGTQVLRKVKVGISKFR